MQPVFERPIPQGRLRRVTRAAGIVGIGGCVLSLAQCTVVASLGGPIEWRIGQQTQVGLSATAVRVLWSADGRSEIAWDEVGDIPMLKLDQRQVFVDIPLWLLFVPASVLAVLFYRRRHPATSKG